MSDSIDANGFIKKATIKDGIISAELTPEGVKKFLPDYDSTEGLSIGIQEVSAREDEFAIDPFLYPERLYVTEEKGTFEG